MVPVTDAAEQVAVDTPSEPPRPPSPVPARAPMRHRVAGSVRFRLTVSVMLVVGLTLLGGGALLVRWVEATLVNDLRTRNERILTSMADSITRNQVPPEFFAPVGELTMEEPAQQLFGAPGVEGRALQIRGA